MEKQEHKTLSRLLPVLVAALLGLTFIPGTWILKYYNPGAISTLRRNFYSCYSPFSILSGIACTLSLATVLLFQWNPSPKRLTVTGVLLEAAAILSVADPIYQVLFHYSK